MEFAKNNSYSAQRISRCSKWRVCVLISENLCPDGDWFSVAKSCVLGGASTIQLREKKLDGGQLLERALKLIDLCRPAGVDVIINDRLDVALLSGADGVHLGQGDIPASMARTMAEARHASNFLIGVSTARLEQAKSALEDGADYCGLGPMFVSTTKHKDRLAGLGYLREFAKWNKLAHLAISGITPENIGKIKNAGGRAVAVSSCVCAAKKPGDVVKKLNDVLDDG